MFGKNLTPASPFYFVKPLQERVQLVLTFDQKNKNNLMIQIAGERLEEIQQLAASDNSRAISSAANSYRQTMTEVSDNLVSLSGQNKNVTDLLGNLETETAKHNVILEQVRIQVPNQADAAVGEALKASWKGTDTVADLNNRPAIPDDLVARLQSLQSQGLLSSQEVNKLIGVKSRAEARQEVGKYVKEGVVSQSDFISLNETSKSLYPDEFFKIHETMRFQEMQRLEEQKPGDTVLNKIQAFAKTYNPGDQVPVELRKYWVPVVRLEEIQNTLRPDLIDASLFKPDGQDSKKFNEIVERFKPRPEDLAMVNNFISKNNVEIGNLPVEYQRMYNLSQKYGAQCGAGFDWVSRPQSPAGGYCAPSGADARNKINCPSNSHFVPVSDNPNGGYCIPNYTQNDSGQSSGRSTFNNPYALPPLTTTPGGPYYTGQGKCGPNSNWVPEAVNPQGGYCVPNPQANTQVTGPSRESQEAACKSGGGTCVSWNNGACGCERPDSRSACKPPERGCESGKNWDQQACTCRDSDYNYPTTQGGGNNSGPSRESQEAACRSGGGTCVSWVNGACGCVRASDVTNNPPMGYGSCPSGQYWTGSNCQNSSQPPTPESTPPPPPQPNVPVETASPAPSSPPVSEPAPVAPKPEPTVAN